MDFHNQQPVKFLDLKDAAAQVKDGDTIAIGGFWFVRMPIAFIEEIVDRGIKDLTIITWGPGLALEMLLAAKAIKKVIFCFVSMDLFGLSPLFRKAVENSDIEWEEWTALRLIQAFEAGKKRLPSNLMQPPFGTNFLENSEDFRLVDCPITGESVNVLKGVEPDVAIIHAQRADQRGNLQIQGAFGMDRLILGAAKKTFVTVEEVVPVGQFEPDPRGSLIPHFLVNSISQVKGGAYPCSCLPYYVTDYWHLGELTKNAKRTKKYDNVTSPVSATKLNRIETLERFAKVLPTDLNINLEEEQDTDYTVDELMAVAMAKEVKDHSLCTVGTNTPLALVAYLLAKRTHAQQFTLIPFTGLNDISVYPVTLSLAETFAFHNSATHWGMEDLYHYMYQRGLTNIEYSTTAQIDKRGRINNSIIGDRMNIKVRLPGQGGMGDVAIFHQTFLTYVTRHEKNRLVDSVDFVSGERYFVSDDERENANLPKGYTKLITNLGIFELDQTTKVFELTHIHPGVSLEEINEKTGFEIVVSKNLKETPKPTKEALTLIRKELDPFGFRKLEFLTGDDRLALIQSILRKEQLALFGEELITS